MVQRSGFVGPFYAGWRVAVAVAANPVVLRAGRTHPAIKYDQVVPMQLPGEVVASHAFLPAVMYPIVMPLLCAVICAAWRATASR